MEEWKTDKIENLLDALIDYRGKTPQKVNMGIPLITAKIVKGGRIDTPEEFLAYDDYDSWMRRGYPQIGDVVLTTEAPLGEVAQISYLPVALAQRIVTLRGKEGILDSTYLKYFLQSEIGQKRLSARETGTTVTGIKQSELRKVEITYPSFSTQCKIASILKSLDDKIELNNRINHNLEQQAQALYKSWFVDFEPFKDGKFVESELGMIPEGWSVKKAEEFCEINIGKTPPRKEHQWFSNDSSDVIWISISDMGPSGVYISKSSEMLTKEACKKFNVVIVPEGTVLLSFKLTVGRVSIAAKNLTTNEAIARFLVPTDAMRSYLYLALKSYDYSSLGSTSSIATAVNSKIIKGMALLCPPEDIIEKFGAQVTGMFSSIKTLQNEISCLREQRDSLLPRLMSGKLTC